MFNQPQIPENEGPKMKTMPDYSSYSQKLEEEMQNLRSKYGNPYYTMSQPQYPFLVSTSEVKALSELLKEFSDSLDNAVAEYIKVKSIKHPNNDADEEKDKEIFKAKEKMLALLNATTYIDQKLVSKSPIIV